MLIITVFSASKLTILLILHLNSLKNIFCSHTYLICLLNVKGSESGFQIASKIKDFYVMNSAYCESNPISIK